MFFIVKRSLIIVGIILAISAFFFRSYLFGGKLLFPTNLLVAFYSPWNTQIYPGWKNIPFKGLGSDNLFIFYPMKTMLRKAIAEKSLPLWTPFNFTGGPLWGDGQSAPMYPFTYLYLLPSLPDAFSIMVLLVPTLTMLFTYGMLRHFKLSPFASLFGAVTFAFSGFMSVWMEENPAVSQSALWLPLLLWLADLLITESHRRWFLLFTLATAVMMSSGFLQICLYEIFFIGIYALFRNWKKAWLVLLSGASGLLLVAPYLFVTWEAYKLSPRDFVAVPEIRSIFLVQWSHIISLFNPDWIGNPGTFNFFGVGSYYDKALFIGVVPLVFALIGLWSKKNSMEKFLWAMVGFTLFMGFSSPVTQWIFSLPIPILSSMLPSRIFYLTSFSLAIIAASVFDRNQKHALRPIIVVFLTIFILLELFLIVYYVDLSYATDIRSFFVYSMKLTDAYPKILIRNIAVSTGLIILTIILLKFRQKKLLLFLTILSSWYFTSKSLYFGQRQFVFPENPVISKLQAVAGIDRVGYANQPSRIPSSANVVYRLYTEEGLNPVFPLRFGQLIRSAINGGKITTNIPRINVELDVQQANPKILSLLDIKYVIEKKESGYAGKFPTHTSIWENTYFRIWKNPDVLPRAFVVQTATVQTDPQKILDALYASDLRTTAIVEEPVSVTKNAKSSDAEIISYRMNDLTIKSHSGGLLVVSDNWAPGWRATIDGKSVPVYRTNFTFRGVPVPPGNHTVFMYYWPTSLTLGFYAMGGGILMLLGSMLLITWKKPSS